MFPGVYVLEDFYLNEISASLERERLLSAGSICVDVSFDN